MSTSAMTSNDLILAAAVVAVAVVGARAWIKGRDAAKATAGGPFANGSYFSAEAQSVWAIPDQQLQENMAWADL